MTNIQLVNKKLIDEYPFLWPLDEWSLEPAAECDYSRTLLDDMPEGWITAIAPYLCYDLKEQLVKDGLLDTYKVLQVKEKFGGLRWYDSGGNDATRQIVRYYELLSEITCAECGAPANYLARGWIYPYCERCAAKEADRTNRTLEKDFIPLK